MPRGKKENFVSETQQRLCQLAEALGISNRELSRSIGMSDSYIASLSNDITLGVANKISITYPQVNLTWLVTGKGEILIKSAPLDNLHEYILEENRVLKEKNEKLTEENKKLFAEVAVLKERLSQKEQEYAPLGKVAECAVVKPYGLAK